MTREHDGTPPPAGSNSPYIGLPFSIAWTVPRRLSAVNGSRRIGISGGSYASASGVDRPMLAR